MRGQKGYGQTSYPVFYGLTGETPFKLAYGSEAVIPAEVHMASHKVKGYEVEENEVQLCFNLDLIDEVRTDAEQRTARYKNLMAR